MYRVKSGARFARVPKAVLGIQSYLAQPDRRVIFAHAADVQYVRRTRNASGFDAKRGARAASAAYKRNTFAFSATVTHSPTRIIASA